MHNLELNYQQFKKRNKSLANTVIDKKYIVYDKIGSGSYGYVYKAMNDENKKIVAIKLLDIAAINQEQSKRVQEIRKRLANTESELMMKVKSDHVMKLYDVYQNKDLKILACQYCNGGTLYQQLVKRKKIPERQAIQIIKQIILGLADMHKLNIIHRDLKSDNIMSHNGVFKIIDLGFARMIPPSISQVVGTVLGTIVTMAPEIMKRQKYGLKADIWSIGIILYELIYGNLPYQPMITSKMYEQIMKKNLFSNNGFAYGVQPSPQVLNLLKKLLVIDQNQRIGWQQLVNQSIFQDKKQLPNEFILTVSFDKIKDSGLQKVTERTEDDIIQKIETTPLIEKQKQKSMNKVKINTITQKQMINKIKDIDKTEQNMVDWVFINYLQCLKTKLIYYEIIKPLQNNNLLDFHQRKVIEFMYLISSRCYLNISVVNLQFAQSADPLILSIKKIVKEMYSQVSNTFNYYSARLTKKENKVGSIVLDGFSKIFNADDMKIKDKFLTGIQNLQYTKNQQIQYTYNKYIKQLTGEMKEKNNQVFLKLKNYKEINNIKRQDLNGRIFFNDKVKQILSQSNF